MPEKFNLLGRKNRFPNSAGVHPSWLFFIKHCRALGFGEIEKLKIQDGLPVSAEESIKKIKRHNIRFQKTPIED